MSLNKEKAFWLVLWAALMTATLIWPYSTVLTGWAGPENGQPQFFQGYMRLGSAQNQVVNVTVVIVQASLISIWSLVAFLIEPIARISPPLENMLSRRPQLERGRPASKGEAGAFTK